MLALLTILSEEMKDLSTCQKRIFMDKLQDGHVPEYLEMLIREAGAAARSYRSHSTAEGRAYDKQQGNVEGTR